MLSSTDINLSSLMSREPLDHRIEIVQSGVQALSLQAIVSPVAESDQEFFGQYLANLDQVDDRPTLQTPRNLGKHQHRRLRDIFAGEAHGEQDQLTIVREVKHLEEREKAQDEEIKLLEKQIAELTTENFTLRAEADE